ncbi:MAG TPA: cytochrome c oxidase subunit II, partial [Gammaproteobacteria bacterium]
MNPGVGQGRKIGLPLIAAPYAVHAEAPMQSALDPQAPPAGLIATLSWWMIAVFGLVFIVVMLIGGAGLWRGRRGAARSLSARASRNLVIAGGVAVPLVILIALVIGSVMVGQASTRAYADDALTIEVIGRRWWWEVRYLDRDGKTLAVTANEIHLPAGEPVRLLLRSEDVIHSFWAPNLDGKTDMIPGMTNIAWLRIDNSGVYRGQCAE